MPQTSAPQAFIRNVSISDSKKWYVIEARFGQQADPSGEMLYVRRLSISNGVRTWMKNMSFEDFLAGRKFLEAKDYARMVIAALKGDPSAAKCDAKEPNYLFVWNFDEATGHLSIQWEVALQRFTANSTFEHLLCEQDESQGFLNECIKELVDEVQVCTARMWELEEWHKKLQDLKTVTDAARKRARAHQDADRKRLCKYAANALNRYKREAAKVIREREDEEQGRQEREDAGLRDSDREDEQEETLEGATQGEQGGGDEGSQGSQRESPGPSLVWKDQASPAAQPRAGRRRRRG